MFTDKIIIRDLSRNFSFGTGSAGKEKNLCATEDTRTSTLKNLVYRKVVEDICSGDFQADAIFTERQLIEKYKISKAPVREALIQLCHEDVLRSIPRCGYQVIQISAANIQDLTELRLYLELSSLPSVLENLTEQSIREFKAMIAMRLAMDDKKKDLWTAWNNNINFHLRLNAVAGNMQVTKVLERALNACTRAYAQAFTADKYYIAPSGENLHDKIIYALECRELYTAQGHLKQDITMTEEVLLNRPADR
jgi:DNA-binding GntR family transcriptional regulator